MTKVTWMKIVNLKQSLIEEICKATYNNASHRKLVPISSDSREEFKKLLSQDVLSFKFIIRMVRQLWAK